MLVTGKEIHTFVCVHLYFEYEGGV